MSIDAAEHQFVVEELDDQTLVIKESQLSELKRRLDEVILEKVLVLTWCWYENSNWKILNSRQRTRDLIKPRLRRYIERFGDLEWGPGFETSLYAAWSRNELSVHVGTAISHLRIFGTDPATTLLHHLQPLDFCSSFKSLTQTHWAQWRTLLELNATQSSRLYSVSFCWLRGNYQSMGRVQHTADSIKESLVVWVTNHREGVAIFECFWGRLFASVQYFAVSRPWWHGSRRRLMRYFNRC